MHQFINTLQGVLCSHLASTMQNLVKLHTTITKLQHFKHLKIGKNLHANMEGFRRAGHILGLKFCSTIIIPLNYHNYYDIHFVGYNSMGNV